MTRDRIRAALRVAEAVAERYGRAEQIAALLRARLERGGAA